MNIKTVVTEDQDQVVVTQCTEDGESLSETYLSRDEATKLVADLTEVLSKSA